MSSDSFGSWLKSMREARGLSLADLSRATKIKERLLDLLERGHSEAMPAPVFVRGFVLAYARAVGADPDEALTRLGSLASTVSQARLPAKVLVPVDEPPEPNSASPRRFGVVMVVILILVVATLTLSLLLRHGAAAGGGIS